MTNSISYNLTGAGVTYVIIDATVSLAAPSNFDFEEPPVIGQVDCARAVSDYFHWRAGTLPGAALSFGQMLSGQTPKKIVPSSEFIERMVTCLSKKDYERFIIATLEEAIENEEIDRVGSILSHIKTIDANMLMSPSVITKPEILKIFLDANKTSEADLINVLDQLKHNIFDSRRFHYDKVRHRLHYVNYPEEVFEMLFAALHKIPTSNPLIYHLPLNLARKSQYHLWFTNFHPNLSINARLHGCSIAMNAAFNGDFDLLKALVDIGADVGHNSTDHWESAPLALLMNHHRNNELENYIVDVGMKRDRKEFAFFLTIAIKYKRHELINRLLTTYPSGSICPCHYLPDLSPFDYALDGHDELIPMLFSRGIDGHYDTPNQFLMIAMKRGRNDICDTLWILGANYRALDFSQQNPTEYSMMNLQIVNRIIEASRYLKAPISPFFVRVAINKGDRLMVKILLKAGVSMNAADYPEGESPLEQAVNLGFHHLINTILNKMNKVNDRALCESVIRKLRAEKGKLSVIISALIGMNSINYGVIIEKIESFLERT